MSEDEKAQQIGRLTRRLREAKENFAHLSVKLGTMSSVYTDVGKLLSCQLMDAVPNFVIENERLRIPSSSVNGEFTDGLLNEEQLIKLLREYMESRTQVRTLESQLQLLG